MAERMASMEVDMVERMALHKVQEDMLADMVEHTLAGRAVRMEVRMVADIQVCKAHK